MYLSIVRNAFYVPVCYVSKNFAFHPDVQNRFFSYCMLLFVEPGVFYVDLNCILS